MTNKPDAQQPRVTVAGSDRKAASAAQSLGPVDPSTPIHVTVVLRRKNELPETAAVNSPPLSSAELGERYGADPADVTALVNLLESHGVTVESADAASRRVRASGPAGTLSELFGTDLDQVRTTDPVTGQAIEHRARQGALSVPAEIGDAVVAVLGLDNRPQARTRLVAPAAAAAASTSYNPIQLAAIYGAPANTDGTGQTLAIIELGGGFNQSDLDHYFGGLGIATPAVRAVEVDGATNAPTNDPSGPDGEVLLDIDVAGGIAPKADIAVYFAPNTDAGFVDAISQAAHATPTPTAISISWGQSEDDWTGQARTAMDAAIADACALGATVTVAAGDDGSTDRATDKQSHVDFPASSPHALACGGTSLDADPSTGSVTSETVWNNGTGNGATGGGVSDTFPLPTWQGSVGVPTRAGATGSGRGVPDVAADADPSTGYQVYVDGKAMVYGGTSAVAPLWAALVCRLAQELGHPLGQLQPALYANAKKGHATAGLRDITSGNNGAYKAGKGWDACTGLGSPNGTALLAALKSGVSG
jgi:kumamolisin